MITSIIGMNIFTAIIRPICEYLWIPHEHGMKSIIYLTLTNLIQLSFAPFVTRLWMLYYDYSHHLNALNGKWRHEIFEKEIQNKSAHWTLQYKWLGNEKLISSVFVSICIVFIAIVYIFGIDGHKYTQYLPTLLLIPMFIYIHKIRECRDEFFIRGIYIKYLPFAHQFFVYQFIFVYRT